MPGAPLFASTDGRLGCSVLARLILARAAIRLPVLASTDRRTGGRVRCCASPTLTGAASTNGLLVLGNQTLDSIEGINALEFMLFSRVVASQSELLGLRMGMQVPLDQLSKAPVETVSAGRLPAMSPMLIPALAALGTHAPLQASTDSRTCRALYVKCLDALGARRAT